MKALGERSNGLEPSSGSEDRLRDPNGRDNHMKKQRGIKLGTLATEDSRNVTVGRWSWGLVHRRTRTLCLGFWDLQIGYGANERVPFLPLTLFT